MKSTIRQKLIYKFERFLSKGGSSIFKTLFIIFLSVFGLLIALRYLVLLLFPQLEYFNSFFDHIWVTFLQMTSPGNMNQDSASPAAMKILTILAGFAGVVLLSMLIAFITSALNSVLYEFRKGRGQVLEKDHTIILGWNNRVIDILKELVMANESEDYGSVVILAEDDKEAMDDYIAKRLTETMTTEIITTSGNPSSISELHRVNITGAKSVILLAKCSENATLEQKILSDTQAIKSVMAIKACHGEDFDLPVIVEVFTDEKRQIIDYFDNDDIIALDSWLIMGKLLMQTSLTSGLQLVYNEILSFDGGEIYFHQADWDGARFNDLIYHFKDGVPLGIFNESEGLILRPDPDRKMIQGDDVIILAEDDSTIHWESNALIQGKDFPLADLKLEPQQKKTLMLGWHNVAEIYIREAADYLEEGSIFEIMHNGPNEEIKETIKGLQEEFDEFKITLIENNPLSRSGLANVDPNFYNNILILSQDPDIVDLDRIDSDTLIILLLLRERLNDESESKIITQVLNTENQKLINQTTVDDFIISNKLITMVLAQLSEEPKLKLLYDDLFSEEGSEIYVKPASLYFTEFPQQIRFVDAILIAQKRDEICLGIRKGSLTKDIDQNFGVRLNLPKDETITIEKGDFLVVLAEDEL